MYIPISPANTDLPAPGLQFADGTMDDVSVELKAFLDYVAEQDPEDSYAAKLEEVIKEAKKNREWSCLLQYSSIFRT